MLKNLKIGIQEITGDSEEVTMREDEDRAKTIP